MARKPERYNAIAERNGMTDVDDTMVYASAGKQYSVALYARLSVEKDGCKSDSIESQFMIMKIMEKMDLRDVRNSLFLISSTYFTLIIQKIQLLIFLQIMVKRNLI